MKCCSLFLAEAATNVTAKCSFATAHQTTAIMQISSVAFKEVLYMSILRPLTVSVWWWKRPSANKEQEGRKQVKTANKVTNKQTSSMKTFDIMTNHMWLTGGNDHLLLMYCSANKQKSSYTLVYCIFPRKCRWQLNMLQSTSLYMWSIQLKKYIICEHVSFNLSGYFALMFTHSFMPVYILKVFIKIPFRVWFTENCRFMKQ